MTVNCTQDISNSSTEILMRKTYSAYAKRETEKIFDRSELLDNANEYPKLNIDEIKMGKTLGKGSFGIAHECKFVFGTRHYPKPKISFSRYTNSIEPDSIGDDMSPVENSGFIPNNCRREGGSTRQYAIKMLHEDAVQDPEMFIRGSIDMAVETRIISSIDHPNIIKIYANGETPYEANYFIVMDRLYDTLQCR